MQAHQGQARLQRRFIWSLLLTGGIFIVEVVGSLWSGSLALLSDAGHVFVDAFALALSYAALRLASRPANNRHTYGFHRMEVLAALINGALLSVIVVEILREAWHRWQHPVAIKSTGMLIIAVAGLVVNLVVALLLGGHAHEHHDRDEHEHEAEAAPAGRGNLNVRSAYLHVLGDAGASVGVILAAVIIALTRWMWVDPIISVFISLLIALSAWRVLKEALHILMEGVPDGVELEAVAEKMLAVPGVEGIHDLHIWSLCPENIALSAHVVASPAAAPAELLASLNACLRRAFGITHTTLQVEGKPCGQGETVMLAAEAERN